MRDTRLLYVLGAIVALALLFVLLRPGDDGGEAAATIATTQTGTQTQSTTTESETGGTTTATTPTLTRWLVDTRDDDLDRLAVPRETRVRLVVIANVSDHVHVHGYDLMRDVSPGRPAVLQFRARLVGRFEIELEDQAREIAQLTVEP
jgi:hypothetical protein